MGWALFNASFLNPVGPTALFSFWNEPNRQIPASIQCASGERWVEKGSTVTESIDYISSCPVTIMPDIAVGLLGRTGRTGFSVVGTGGFGQGYAETPTDAQGVKRTITYGGSVAWTWDTGFQASYVVASQKLTHFYGTHSFYHENGMEEPYHGCWTTNSVTGSLILTRSSTMATGFRMRL